MPTVIQINLSFDKINQLIDDIPIEEIIFDNSFNQPIENVTFPSNLQSLTFGHCFNQPIENVTFPSSLQSLSFNCMSRFNHPIENVTFPSSLQSLSFGWYFNQPIKNVTFPSSLQSLTFQGDFNQPIDPLKLPIFLTNIKVCSDKKMKNELLLKVKSRREEIFQLIKLFKENPNNFLSKIQEIQNLFQILSYRDHQDYTGKIGYQLLEMYWNQV